MSAIQQMNSKANVKKRTNADLPYSPAQPVISRYSGVSTLGQTTINLTFSVDQSISSQFFLTINGVTLTPGVGNDYIFSSIGADNRSNTVTLSVPMPAGLNVQAWMLGMKPEVEFQTDNRFVQSYDYLSQGFQGFIASSQSLLATTGTPGTGQFFSTIPNRAAIVDMTQDLRPRMGIERNPLVAATLNNEAGPNGEAVYQTNDQNVRLVGTWSPTNDLNGSRPQSNVASDYAEFTFFGTGLNLALTFSGPTLDIRAAVDGAAEGSAIGGTISNVYNNRNYNHNQIYAVASGLSLGIHTVKVRLVTGALAITAYEVVNTSSSIVTNPGVGYNSGKKATSAAQSSVAYATGVTGGRGGRVLVYQNADGTIGRAVQLVNPSSAFYTSADHTNEEVARTYHFREFGNGRADDFSTLSVTPGNRAFTLEDGVTTLTAQNYAAQNFGAGESLYAQTGTGDYITITFVGTGLDFINARNAASAQTYTVTVDTTTAVTTTAIGGTGLNNTVKICSGLPYGTHTVKILSTSGSNGIAFSRFIVYQPKKPTLPTGATDLGDYNVMADYVGVANTATAETGGPGQGVLRKMNSREFVYSGTWTTVASQPQVPAGVNFTTSTSGDYFQYTFFGTGVELSCSFSVTGNNQTVAIDGANYTGTAVAKSATGTSTWTPGTSTWLLNGTSGSRLQITGLALGLHTVRVTKASGTDQLLNMCCDVITPIHSQKSNSSLEFQNALPVGSQGIRDNRKLTPVKDAISAQRSVSKASGIQSNPTTTSTSFVPVPDMAVTHNSMTGRIEVNFNGRLDIQSNIAINLQIMIDGVAVQSLISSFGADATVRGFISSLSIIADVTPGPHKVEVYWLLSAPGTATATSTQRYMTVKDI